MADVVADAPSGVASGAPGARRGRDRAPAEPLPPSEETVPARRRRTRPPAAPRPSCVASSSHARTCRMHELRRRFELNGSFDDVSPISTEQGCVYVGLPRRESVFIAELLRSGDIGVELSHDPPVPIVIGVYAMRPVSR